MNPSGWKIWMNLTFKTSSYRKNFDIVTKNENIITEHEGVISLIRLEEQLPPFTVGHYSFSIWNIDLAKKIKADINRLVKSYGKENAYSEVDNLIKNKEIHINEYNKILFIHNLILHPNYRKLEVTEEFVEFIYRDFHSEKNAIIAFVMPIQNNQVDYGFYSKELYVKVRKTYNDENDYDLVLAFDYYQIGDFLKKEDTETNEYKLFSTVTKCGFNRIDDSHLFLYSPEKTIVRMKEKQKIIDEYTPVNFK